MDPAEFAHRFFEVIEILSLDVGEVFNLADGDPEENVAGFFEDYENQEGRPADPEAKKAVIAVIKEAARILAENGKAAEFGEERGRMAGTWGGTEPTEKDRDAFAAFLGRKPSAGEEDIFLDAFLQGASGGEGEEGEEEESDEGEDEFEEEEEAEEDE